MGHKKRAHNGRHKKAMIRAVKMRDESRASNEGCFPRTDTSSYRRTDFNPRKYLSILFELLDSDQKMDVYLDTNQLIPSSNLIYNYTRTLGLLRNDKYDERFRGLNTKLDVLAKGNWEAIEREQIKITKGVLDEVKKLYLCAA
jgi:hypothetical protein